MNSATFAGQTYSKAPDRFPAGCPGRVVAADGAYVVGSGGRTYIDTVSGLGAVILGHRHPAVDEAVRRQMRRGVSFPLPTALEEEVAQTLCRMVPSAERVRFGKNGADVTGAAVRIARAVTGREHVAMAWGAYHGHHDWSMTRPPKNGGVMKAIQAHTRFFKQADSESVAALFDAPEKHWPAAVVVEPVLSSDPKHPPPGWFNDLRWLCDQHGALLIFDEVVTGLRAPECTMQRYFGVTPDLTALCKALGNGWPVSALVGKREYVDRIENGVFFSLTHGGEAASLAAARATLRMVETQAVPARLAAVGHGLKQHFAELVCEYGVDADAVGYDARPVFRFADAGEKRGFLRGLLRHGVLSQGYINVTLAHGRADVQAQLKQAMRRAMDALVTRKAA